MHWRCESGRRVSALNRSSLMLQPECCEKRESSPERFRGLSIARLIVMRNPFTSTWFRHSAMAPESNPYVFAILLL